MITNLNATPNHEVIGDFGEFFSGRGDFRKRPEFMKALEVCKREGATLVVTKVDRLSRDVESGSHLLNNYKVVVTSQPEADKMMPTYPTYSRTGMRVTTHLNVQQRLLLQLNVKVLS